MSQSTAEPSDAELIATILQGGGNSFGKSSLSSEAEGSCRILVERYWKVVFVLLRSRISSDRDAEDLAQEAFLRAFRSLSQLVEPKLFLGWLLRICRNLATDHLRKRRSDTSLEALGTAFVENQPTRSDPSKEVQDRLERDEKMDRVLKAVARLPEKYGTVITLRYLKDLSNRELAERLGEPEGTIRNRVFRALAKLRDILLRTGGLDSSERTTLVSGAKETLAPDAKESSAPAAKEAAATDGGRDSTETRAS